MKPTLLISLCLALTTTMASAQTHQDEGLFVHGGAFASHELRSHTDLDPSVLALLVPAVNSSTVAGGTVGIGVFLRPFLSVRADALFEGESNDSLPAAILTTLLADLPTISRPVTQASRTRMFSAQTLLAYHLASSTRFRLAVLGGVSFNRRRTRYSSELFIPAIPALPGITPALPTRQIDYAFVSYTRDLVVGADGELSMGERLALVPQFRVVGGSGTIRLQPGVSVRWRP